MAFILPIHTISFDDLAVGTAVSTISGVTFSSNVTLELGLDY